MDGEQNCARLAAVTGLSAGSTAAPVEVDLASPSVWPLGEAAIFQVFQTLKPRDQVEGSGMGLAVVKKIVESQGGQIAVESDLGQGATFRFTWPQAKKT